VNGASPPLATTSQRLTYGQSPPCTVLSDRYFFGRHFGLYRFFKGQGKDICLPIKIIVNNNILAGLTVLETVQYEMSAVPTALISDRVVSQKTGNLSCVGFDHQGSDCVGLECVEDNCTGSLAGYSKLKARLLNV
jgi:hypothetical protein